MNVTIAAAGGEENLPIRELILRIEAGDKPIRELVLRFGAGDRRTPILNTQPLTVNICGCHTPHTKGTVPKLYVRPRIAVINSMVLWWSRSVSMISQGQLFKREFAG